MSRWNASARDALSLHEWEEFPIPFSSVMMLASLLSAFIPFTGNMKDFTPVRLQDGVWCTVGPLQSYCRLVSYYRGVCGGYCEAYVCFKQLQRLQKETHVEISFSLFSIYRLSSRTSSYQKIEQKGNSEAFSLLRSHKLTKPKENCGFCEQQSTSYGSTWAPGSNGGNSASKISRKSSMCGLKT